jgi:hypothetical protein
MSIFLKVLEKALANKDYDFLAGKLADKLLEMGWSHDDIAKLADRLTACCR